MTSTMLKDEDMRKVEQLNDQSNNNFYLEQQQIRSQSIHVIGEQKPSILNLSCENLSVSQSIMEQGFNKHSLLGWQIINRHTILNTCTIILAISCIFFEIFKLPKVLENSKNIEMLKRDLEALQRQLYAEVNENDNYNNYYYNDDDDDDDDDDGGDDDEDDYESDLQDDINAKQILEETGSRILSTASLSVNESAHYAIEESVRRNKKFNITKESNGTAPNSVLLGITSSRLNDLLTNKTEGASTTNFLNARSKRDTTRNARFVGLFYHDNRMSMNAPRSSLSVQNGKKNEYLENNLKSTATKARIVRLRREPHMVSDETRKPSVSKVHTKRNFRVTRQIYAAHYGADSSIFTDEDEHTGNGRFRHHEGIFKAWRPSDWMSDFGMDRYFSLNSDGKVTVHETGLYLIYAQIHYLDEHDENGFHLLVNSRPILQCMVYSPGIGHKSRSCFSAQVTFLHNNDRIILKDVGTSRYTLFQKDKSFFGLVRIGDMKHPLVHTPQSMETEG